MEKSEIMKRLESSVLASLRDTNFRRGVYEQFWDGVHKTVVREEELGPITGILVECVTTLDEKIEAAFGGKLGLTLKEAILKHFGPGGQFFSPEATVFAESDAESDVEMLNIESDSCCGSGILALIWRAANDAQSGDLGGERQAIWANAIEEAKVIYYS